MAIMFPKGFTLLLSDGVLGVLVTGGEFHNQENSNDGLGRLPLRIRSEAQHLTYSADEILGLRRKPEFEVPAPLRATRCDQVNPDAPTPLEVSAERGPLCCPVRIRAAQMARARINTEWMCVI